MPPRKTAWPAPWYRRGPDANTEIAAGVLTVAAVARYLEDVAGLVRNPAVAEQIVHVVLDPSIALDARRVLGDAAPRRRGPNFRGQWAPPAVRPE